MNDVAFEHPARFGLPSPLSLRFERKFRVDVMSQRAITQVIKMHPAAFRQIYQPRTINNIYFDTADLRSYWETVEGVRDRTKVRIRWYGTAETIDRPVLELKIKHALTCGKASLPLPAFELDQPALTGPLGDLMTSPDVPDHTRETFRDLRPALLNSYSRSYFLSADGAFRVTVDRDLKFNRLSGAARGGRVTSTDRVIVELKYEEENDEGARGIATGFPFRATKFSKYAYGIGGDF